MRRSRWRVLVRTYSRARRYVAAAARRYVTSEALAERMAGLLLVGLADSANSGASAHFIAGAAGAILFRRDIDGPDQARKLVADLQAAASAPGQPTLLIAIDQEGGPVERLGTAGTPP